MKKIISFILAAATCVLLALSITGCGKKTAVTAEYTIAAVYSEGFIEGEETYVFQNAEDAEISEVKFNLYANAYRKNAVYKPITEENELLSSGGTEITECRFNGEVAEFSVCGEDENVLAVKTSGISRGESAEIKIKFKTTIPYSDLRLGETGDTVNLGDFFPVACKRENGEYVECVYSPYGDPYYSDCADYDFSLSVPSEYVVASSGFPVSSTVEGDRTVYSYSLENGRDFAFVLSKNYEVASAAVGKTTVTVYGDKEFCDRVLPVLRSATAYFSDAFGAFPYKSMSVAKTGFLQGGMEYSGLCFISDDLTEEEEERAVVHEIAHEWWHAAVGNDQINEAFIDEGLAEYSTYLYFSENGKADVAADMAEKAKANYKAYYDVVKILRGEANTGMIRPLSEFSGEYEYVAVAYAKPLLMMVEYEDLVGRNKAKKKLCNLYKDNAFGVINSEILCEALGYGEFFRSYIEGKVII